MLGYRPYADDVVAYFVQKTVANGIDIMRIFDALNDPRNLETCLLYTSCLQARPLTGRFVLSANMKGLKPSMRKARFMRRERDELLFTGIQLRAAFANLPFLCGAKTLRKAVRPEIKSRFSALSCTRTGEVVGLSLIQI